MKRLGKEKYRHRRHILMLKVFMTRISSESKAMDHILRCDNREAFLLMKTTKTTINFKRNHLLLLYFSL